VVTDIPDRLPPVLGDRIQLEQVLLNLIVNAIEASESPEAETEPRTVRVRVAVQDADQIRVSVSDEGPGISDDDMSRLFDRFFSTKQSGLGMGLAISRSLVENLGGELWATNLSEGGACFSFTLNTAD
jgi:two-component system sensor kinase FixL